MIHDWLPSSRVEQLGMAKNWSSVLISNAGTWNVPAAELAKLDSLTAEARDVLSKAQSTERTKVITAQCKSAFGALVEELRFIKNHYFLCPPLTDPDIIALGLKPHDSVHTPAPIPSEQAEADILRPGVHLLELLLRVIGGGSLGNTVGFRVYWGIMPPGGAAAEAATGPKRELMKPPVSGEELPHSKFTRRKRERFDFDPGDSGKTVYFCIRLENAKGEAGPWGAIFSAVIP
jgi:hypothetical protein